MSAVTMRQVDDKLPQEPGDFRWQTNGHVRRLVFMLPCRHVHAIPVDGPGTTWTLAPGSEASPTLTPSVFCKSDGDCWHGFITAGVMRSV